MLILIIVSFAILALAKSDNKEILPYFEVAYTTSGEPCIGGCSPYTHQCIASWPPKNEPCVIHDTPAPRFRTTQTHSKYKYCLSNCGYYEWETAWCFVTSDGKWDNCITTETRAKADVKVLPYTMVAYTNTGKPCIGGCSPDTHLCVAHWPPKNEPCVLYNKPAATFKTNQTDSNNNYTTCLSNCGPFAWSDPWCYVTSDGEYDDCVIDEQQQNSTEIIPMPSVPPLPPTTEEPDEEYDNEYEYEDDNKKATETPKSTVNGPRPYLFDLFWLRVSN